MKNSISEINDQSSSIDAVVTWVNGEDPSHAAKLNAYLESLGFKPKSASATRFKSLNEIFYTVKSIIIFAPFIKKIYVVTDQQNPGFELSGIFTENELGIIELVDHRSIFEGYENYLPTFNSISIATMLFRIPNLSEKFIYFNDDVLLIRDTSPETFFSHGVPIIRGRLSLMPEQRILKKIQAILYKMLGISQNKQDRDSFTAAQSAAAKLAGFEKSYLRIGHTPHPLRKSTFIGFYEKNPEALVGNIKYRLRHADQYSAISLANHIEFKMHEARVQNNLNCIYLKPYKGFFLRRKVEKLAKIEGKIFVCIQSLDRASKTRQIFILQWLHNLILNRTIKKSL